MNCLTARQTLELAPFGGATLGDAADTPLDHDPAREDFAWDSVNRALVSEAARHVEGCPTCQTAVRRREQFDGKLGAMIRDVAVPEDLKERLLSGLESARLTSGAGGELTEARPVESSAVKLAEEIVVGTGASQRGSAPPVRFIVGSRRRWLRAASLAAAVCVVAGTGYLVWLANAERVNLENIGGHLATNDLAADDLPEFTHFRGGAAAQIPATMLTKRLVVPARRLEDLDVAVYFFTLPGRGKATLRGRLAVVPKRLVLPSQVPLAMSFLSPATPTIYRNGFCITAWTEREFVYVCCLEGAEAELHQLQPKLQMM